MNQSNNNQILFKILLVILTLATLIYTYFTMQIDGVDFLSATIDHLKSMRWEGQFTLDFLTYLILSALWVMWRGMFTIQSIILGIIASIFGILFFAPYIFYLLTKENGDIRKVLIGKRVVN